MKMVEGCLEVCVILISSAIILGTSYATGSSSQVSAIGQQSQHHQGIKMNFHSYARNNTSVEIPEMNISETHSKSSVIFAKPHNDSKRHLKKNHPYFALFDPLNNVTKRVEVSRHNKLPSISYMDFSDLLAKSENSVNFVANSEKKTLSNGGEIERDDKMKNFIEWDTLRDSEKEVRIYYNGITAKETIVSTGTDEDTGKRQGLKLRQLTDGTHFIQLIYNFENEIQDCEYIKQKSAVEKFLRTFRTNLENAKHFYEKETGNDENLNYSEMHREQKEMSDDYLEDDEGKIEKYFPDSDSGQYEGENFVDFDQEYRNVTFQIIQRDTDLPKEFADWMNYSRLKQKCRENHKVLKQLAYNRKHGDKLAKKLAEEHIERVKRNLDFSLIFPGTKWCGKSHIAEKYTALGGFSKTDKCCRTHDYCHPFISAFEEKYGFYNFRPFTVSHCRCDLRKKRDISDVLLVPGTKWCGKGRRATRYTSLGGFSKTDKCCRVHDTMCPHWIGSLEEKYGLFNWRINTIMHCRCDKRFRACLKMAKTGTANFVGKLFFNVVQTKCFVLKPQKVCLKYSWWKKCEKEEYRKKAYLKENLSY